MLTYEKKLFGATMAVSQQMEEDAQLNVKAMVATRLVTMLEREAEKVGGFLDYETLKVERDTEFFTYRYTHFLSRDEQPLWRFVLGLLPFVPRASEERELPPRIQYRAAALVGVPVEEAT